MVLTIAMATIGTSFTNTVKKVFLCGSGELGKKVVIEIRHYGVEVIACDADANAPAMKVADRSHVFSMLDGEALRQVIEEEKPELVVPEVEAIETDTLAEIEAEGLATMIPTARAPQLTMNREGKRRMAVGLGRAKDLETAREKARGVIAALNTQL